MSTCLALLPKPPVPAEHNPAPPLYYDDFVALADKAWRACKTAFGSSPPPSLLTSPPTHPACNCVCGPCFRSLPVAACLLPGLSAQTPREEGAA